MDLQMSSSDGRKKIHPHKFALWVAMASISMMFAGLTSAYVVRQAQGNWRYYNIPLVFWVSTAAIVLSSITMVMAIRAYKKRQMGQYKMVISATLVLGLLFGLMQCYGFYLLFHNAQPVRINGLVGDAQVVRVNGNPSESFLYIIAGLHLLHVLGGIIALIFVYLRSFRKNIKVYDATGLEIVGGYWHFVDILWVYLFIFFLVNQ